MSVRYIKEQNNNKWIELKNISDVTKNFTSFYFQIYSNSI